MTGSTPLWLLCSSWTSGESRWPPSQGTPTRGPQTGLAPPGAVGGGRRLRGPSFPRPLCRLARQPLRWSEFQPQLLYLRF